MLFTRPASNRYIFLARVLAISLACYFVAGSARFAVAADYQYKGTFTIPASDTQPFGSQDKVPTLFGALPDGSLLAIATQSGQAEVYHAARVGGTYDFSGAGAHLGTLPLASGVTWSSFGGSFLEVSGDGHVAISNGQFGADARVGVFKYSDFGDGMTTSDISWFQADNFSAAWLDNRRLAINAGDTSGNSQVTLLDTQNGATAPILHVTGSSGATAFDASGNLFTGIGYGTGIGQIKEFTANWQNAFLPQNDPNHLDALNFASGVNVRTDVPQLTAGSLRFDAQGNLALGGGPYGGGPNYFDILDGVTRDPNGEWKVQSTLFPPHIGDTLSTGIYGLNYNAFSHEYYAYDLEASFDENGPAHPSQIYVFAQVPEPASLTLLALGFFGLVAVSRRWRRRG